MDIQIVDCRVCHDGLYDDVTVMDLHVHEMEHWKSIPDYCSWVWIPIQGHLWRHSEVRESKIAIPADGQFRPVGGVSTDNPITVRSQSDLQSDHSPITVRSYVLLPFHITRLKRIYRFERGSFFSCENLKLLVKYMIGL